MSIITSQLNESPIFKSHSKKANTSSRSIILFIALSLCYQLVFAQYADKKLSNLKPTMVNVDLEPASGKNLGSTLKWWDNLYLTHDILLNGTRFLSGPKSNTFLGVKSGILNTIGNYNSFIGWRAGYSNTTGDYNTANGFQAMYLNTAGFQNTAYGVNALYYNTVGFNNTAIGFAALFNNLGNSNTATGYQSLYSNTSGSQNTAHGLHALFFNTE